jgi:hypothetical protein
MLHEVFILIYRQFGQLQKNLKYRILNFLFHRIHPYLQEKVMIYSMFISEVNEMRSFVLLANMTFFRKNNI